MGAKDNSKRTPLTIAIAGRNDMFVRAVCKGITSGVQARISTALTSECMDNRDNENVTTCLYAAILRGKSLKPELIMGIIELAPDGLFTVTDSKGRTPLHLAVEYQRCSDEQINVVDKLLVKGPTALNMRTSEHPTNRRSVYQHHAKTREDSMQQGAKEAKERYYEQLIGISEIGRQNVKEQIDLQEINGASATTDVDLDRHHQLGKQDAALPLIKGSGKPSPPTVEHHTGLTLNTKLGHTPSSMMSSTSTAPTRRIEKTAGRVEESLKLAYFHLKKPHELIDYLYFPTQGQRGT